MHRRLRISARPTALHIRIEKREHMPRQQYQDRLDELRDDVLYMSEVVAERLRDGLTALDEKDERLAEEVIEGDGEINRMYLELESDCIDLFALQQPVAGDLRFIAASFKIITDLERIADLATNLGKYTKDAENDVFPDVDVQRIGDAVLDMLEEAMLAYADQDVDACYAVADRDDVVDEFCSTASETVVRDLIQRDEADEAETEALMTDISRLLLTIRDLERVGDHAVNIAARTLYMVENDDELLY
jgi:phosphate transport system protein